MLSVEKSVVSYDTAEGLNMYQPLYRAHSRKHFTEVEKDDLPRSNRPAVEKVVIPDDFRSLKHVANRSPLSPRPFLSAKLAPVPNIISLTTVTAPVVNEIKPFAPIKELFVSPHPDDICYSCFSTVSQGDKGVIDGERVIVTVFSKSRCANGELGEQLKRSIPDISRVRKVEDEAFAGMVGCKLYSLDQPDSSARDEFSRWTHLADQDLEEQHRVVKSHVQFPETVRVLSPILRWAVKCKAAVYMPLGVGCHVDHLLTRVAVTTIFDEIKAERNAKLPIKLTYYEDLPYAYYVTEESIHALAKTVLTSEAKSSLIPVDQDCWEKKRKAVLTYATQMKPTILPALQERAVTLASFDVQQGEKINLKERIWTL
jgi:LmbE family N-acetylglucosaminyl deacetylase